MDILIVKLVSIILYEKGWKQFAVDSHNFKRKEKVNMHDFVSQFDHNWSKFGMEDNEIMMIAPVKARAIIIIIKAFMYNW